MRLTITLVFLAACSNTVGVKMPDDGGGDGSTDILLADGSTDGSSTDSAADGGLTDMSKPADLTPVADLACYPHTNSCTPGAQSFTPDGCEERTCGSDCWWGPWKVKVGDDCVTGTSKTCNAGINCPTFGTQTCIACHWSACNC